MTDNLGMVSTWAGSTEGQIDGLRTAAKFSNPRDLVVDSNDNIFVADGYGTIRKIDNLGALYF